MCCFLELSFVAGAVSLSSFRTTQRGALTRRGRGDRGREGGRELLREGVHEQHKLDIKATAMVNTKRGGRQQQKNVWQGDQGTKPAPHLEATDAYDQVVRTGTPASAHRPGGVLKTS